MITEQEKINRRNFIGGSDAAAVFGFSKWKTPLQVYDRIVNGVDKTESNVALELGNILEPWIIEKFQQHSGLRVDSEIINARRILENVTKNIIHPDYKFIRGNIDGYIESNNTIFEAKTARNDEEFGEEDSFEIPKEYLCQAYHYLSLINAVGVQFYVFFKNSETFKRFFVKRDQEIINALTETEVNFWENHIVKKIPPEIQSVEDIKILYKNSTESKIEIDSNLNDQFYELKEIRNKLKELDKKENELKKEIMFYMKENDTLTYNNKTIATWKSYIQSRFDTNKFKEENQELYEKYLHESTQRRLLIK